MGGLTDQTPLPDHTPATQPTRLTQELTLILTDPTESELVTPATVHRTLTALVLALPTLTVLPVLTVQIPLAPQPTTPAWPTSSIPALTPQPARLARLATPALMLATTLELTPEPTVVSPTLPTQGLTSPTLPTRLTQESTLISMERETDTVLTPVVSSVLLARTQLLDQELHRTLLGHTTAI